MSEATEKCAHDDAQSRAKFEAWWNSDEISSSVWWWRVKKVDAFDIWKTTRAAALEEAAQLIDEETENARHERLYPGLVGTLEECADAIRALAKSEGVG
ncbi:hypothetical protein [Paraburkholderia acidisoli]|uniref:Uncharacterized protein n=1 Tax=Paraburkholderia acidisoli TaxID=2571748 RepID=A0A7Z2GR54_9BURK|nr:hypothetical protein [Paraburkholderia acidisoli]QGZ66325.1 hypothetical protein FAZ98_31520 [Paraburkholderia acidisoli]QGZ66408.1 hypothetical protein FAZ98_32000 [Paraburkholderia acidisoli]